MNSATVHIDTISMVAIRSNGEIEFDKSLVSKFSLHYTIIMLYPVEGMCKCVSVYIYYLSVALITGWFDYFTLYYIKLAK